MRASCASAEAVRLPKRGACVPFGAGCRKVRRGAADRWTPDTFVRKPATHRQDGISRRHLARSRAGGPGAPMSHGGASVVDGAGTMPRPLQRRGVAQAAARLRWLTRRGCLIDSRNAKTCAIPRGSASPAASSETQGGAEQGLPKGVASVRVFARGARVWATGRADTHIPPGGFPVRETRASRANVWLPHPRIRTRSTCAACDLQASAHGMATTFAWGG